MVALKRALRDVLDAVASNHANVVFSRQRWVGVLILAAAATTPRCLLLGLCALLGAELCVRALRLGNTFVPYGYNAILCGIAIGREYAATPAAGGFALLLGVASVLVSAALSALASYVGYLPVLSIPFVLTFWFATGLAPTLPLLAAGPQLDTWALQLPAPLALVLQSFGAFVLLPDVRAGLCVCAALLLHSRIAALLATGAVVLVLSVFQLAHAPLADSTLQLTACSAGLTAVAIGGVWLIPSGGSSLLALGSALLAAFFALGLARPLARLGLPLSFVPYQLAVLAVLSALRQRTPGQNPRLASVVAETPEQLLLNDVAPQPAAAGAPVLRLPFAGAWVCTQGVDGAYTHRGVLRHAYDFEMYGGADGALCVGSGGRTQDYYCFGQPVLAAADGTVVAIENGVPNNAIGEDNAHNPWGNYVILQHAPAVYSLVAHLGPGTVVVYPGQFVWRNQVLGYCGSSGRAPRPHLHFQVQATPALGSPTQASHFHDVVVRREARPRFEFRHVPAQGDLLETLQPDYALAAHFEFPLGATLTYDMGGRLERITSEIDNWGRAVLRSLDRGAALTIARTESRFSCMELRGAQDSVLTLLRLSLSDVPFERYPDLTFRSRVPLRWFGGRLRGVWWDLKAPIVGAHSIELHSRVAIDHKGVAIVGSSLGSPQVATRAEFGTAPGPRVLEVSAFGRVKRAELVVPERRRQLHEAGAHAASPFAVGVGEWS
ncbi:MAG TPA: urea transporter [Polyangiales bacterium]|nr:urea transporter [Polyangiales bacterium]